MVFSDNRVLKLIDMELEEHSISYLFKYCEDSFIWMFLGLYGSILNEEREDF